MDALVDLLALRLWRTTGAGTLLAVVKASTTEVGHLGPSGRGPSSFPLGGYGTAFDAR